MFNTFGLSYLGIYIRVILFHPELSLTGNRKVFIPMYRHIMHTSITAKFRNMCKSFFYAVSICMYINS